MNTDLCADVPRGAGVAVRLLADVDCQAFGLVERGYAALADPGGPMAVALTGLLVLAVAFYGYRLLLGRGLILSDAVGLAVRIGAVLMIAASWASWQTLAYDTLARGPTEIAGEVLRGISAREPLGALQATLNRLDAAGDAFRGSVAATGSPLTGGPASSAMTIKFSAVVLTLSTVGLLVAARLVLALLLAVAPVIAGFILFDATRGIAQGWLRAMLSAALAPLFVLTLLAIELRLLAPMITRLMTEIAAGTKGAVTAGATPILLVVLVFALATIAGIRAGAQIAGGIRLPGGRRDKERDQPAPAPATAEPLVLQQAQAMRIAQALEGIARRDGTTAGTPYGRRLIAATSTGSGARATVRDAGGNAYQPATIARQAATRLPHRSRAALRRDG